MPRLTRLLAFLVLVLLAGCAGNRPDISGQDGQYYFPKQIRYGFTVSNSTGELIKKAEFWTYLPVPVTSHQRVKKIFANYPYRTRLDELGNNSIHFDLEDIPPYGAKVINITVDLLMSDSPVSNALSAPAQFLSPASHIQSDDLQIVALAKSLQEVSPALMARNSYEWVANNIAYEGYVSEDRDAEFAINNRKGDCTEFSYLLTAMYRAQKIPARAIGGYVFSDNGIVTATDYHNWTEFYLDGAWQIADAQKRIFVEQQRNYVAMRVISGNEDELGAQRFSYAGKGLQVEMN
ncbi:MAG: transglutaminase domain-containing protein [Sideroxyarcus sp.]|nr:transglutaminase domain-containing protein [Sideroxyarcus sp.]